MIKRQIVLFGITCASMLAVAGQTKAALINNVPVGNGNFESLGAVQDNNWNGLPANPSSLPGAWVAATYTGYQLDRTGDNISVSGDPDTSVSTQANNDGKMYGHALNLSAITQDLNTTITAGQQIELDFDGGHDTSHPAGTITAEILVGSQTIQQNYDLTAGGSANNGKLLPLTLTGTATVTGDLSIKFINVSGTDWIDGVSVSTTPEPASLGLVSLGGIGLLRRRNRRDRA